MAFLSIVLIVVLAIGFELAYEKIRGSGRMYKADDTMEAMTNSGVQTSLRLIGFGLLSIVIVAGLSQRFF